MPIKKIAEPISIYRHFNRNYKPEELLAELKNLINSGRYEDYILIAIGNGGRSTRIASTDNDLRCGDLFYMLELAKNDIMDL